MSLGWGLQNLEISRPLRSEDGRGLGRFLGRNWVLGLEGGERLNLLRKDMMDDLTACLFLFN